MPDWPRRPRSKTLQLGPGVVLHDHGVADVRPVEAGDETLGPGEIEALDDVGAGRPVGGRGQRQARHLGIARAEDVEAAVFRAEVVPPLRDAVRLVDGEEGEVRMVQPLEEIDGYQPFGRDIKQIQRPLGECALRRPRLARRQGGIERGGTDAQLFERGDLVLHQGDQRGNDDGDARTAERRDLVAERLATARRHQHQRIAARHHMFDDGPWGPRNSG